MQCCVGRRSFSSSAAKRHENARKAQTNPRLYSKYNCRQEPTMPGILLGDEFPNFEADTTIGRIRFHDFLGSSWGILFSHPRDFTPVCTTELACAAKISDEFKKRGDVMAFNSQSDSALPFPIIADDKRVLAVQLGMLDPDERDKDGMPLTARCVFVIGPDKKLKLSILYPATTGRNFDELLRVIDSLQLTAQKKVATPVDWKVHGFHIMLY
ncbi:hypothetical protein INR49_008748 [Caranx melampygus]|nr:hypothetical protein INR49_008748 [Caranx melampygus]